jgi:hypothetical protein
MLETRPIIKVIVGNFLGAAIDAQILKIVVEEVSPVGISVVFFGTSSSGTEILSCSWWQSATYLGQVLGFPALLVDLDGDYETTWNALESGEAHLWPEVWRTEEGDFPPIASLAAAQCDKPVDVRSGQRGAKQECTGNREEARDLLKLYLTILHHLCDLSLCDLSCVLLPKMQMASGSKSSFSTEEQFRLQALPFGPFWLRKLRLCLCDLLSDHWLCDSQSD